MTASKMPEAVAQPVLNKIKELSKVKDGHYRLTTEVPHFFFWKKTVGCGWIHAYTNEYGKNFMFTSKKDTHNPLDFGIDNWVRAWILEIRGERFEYAEFARITPIKAEENKQSAIDFALLHLCGIEPAKPKPEMTAEEKKQALFSELLIRQARGAE